MVICSLLLELVSLVFTLMDPILLMDTVQLGILFHTFLHSIHLKWCPIMVWALLMWPQLVILMILVLLSVAPHALSLSHLLLFLRDKNLFTLPIIYNKGHPLSSYKNPHLSYPPSLLHLLHPLGMYIPRKMNLMHKMCLPINARTMGWSS